MNLSIIYTAIGCLAALVSVIGGFLSVRHNKYLAVNEFLTKIEEDKLIEARKHVYNTSDFPVTDEKASVVVNFYHHWGLMAKKHYLPLWVFNGSNGRGTIRLHKRLGTYLAARRRDHDDSSYGEYFDWLAQKIEKKYFN